jgi:lipid-binding SYLF domain-containing protein
VKYPHFRLVVCAVIAGFASAGPAQAQIQEAAIVDSATNVMNEFMEIPAQGIPRSLISKAEALVIVPGMLKAGFIAGVRRGKGVVVVRDDQRVWRPPQFVTLTGGSVGPQVGVQATDVILVFQTRRSVNGLLSGKFTIGADAAAAAGPVGRQAAAATDGKLQAEILSYSRSRGLFVGVSLDGSVLQIDSVANQTYYRSAGLMSDGTAYAAGAQLPASASRFLAQLATYTSSAVAAPAGPVNTGPGALAQSPGQMNAAEAAPYGAVAGGSPASSHVGSSFPAGDTYGNLGAGNSSAGGTSAMDRSTSMPGRGVTDATGIGHNSTAATNRQAQPATAQQLEMTRQELVTATKQLGSLLNDDWRQYFSLPTEVFEGGEHPVASALNQPIARFARVAKDPRYQVLIDREEFQTVRRLLQQYQQQVQSLSRSTDRAFSSPPVGGGGGAAATRR